MLKNKVYSNNFSKNLSELKTIELISLINGETKNNCSFKLRFVDNSSLKLDYSGNEEELVNYAHEISKFTGKVIEKI